MFVLSNLNELRRAHDEFLAREQRIVELLLNQAGAKAVEHVQSHPEFTPRTGKLQKATKFRVVRAAGGRLMRLSNSRPYAAAIDGGSRAHVITASKAPYLRFRGSKGWVTKKSVNHPGNRPYRFMYYAHDAASRFFKRELELDLTKLADSF